MMEYVLSMNEFITVNYFLASGDFRHLLICLANSLDADQGQHNIGPDLNPNCLTLSVPEYLEKINFEQLTDNDKSMKKNYPACKELTFFTYFLIIFHSFSDNS